MADNSQLPPAPGPSGEFKRKTAPTPPVAIAPLPAGVQKPSLSSDSVREMKKETLRISLPPKPLSGAPLSAQGSPRPPMMVPLKQTLQPTKVIPAPSQLNVTRPLGVAAVLNRPPQLASATVAPPMAKPVPSAPLQANAPVVATPFKPPGVVPPANLGKAPVVTQATQSLAKVSMPAARPMTTSPIPTPLPAPAAPAAPAVLSVPATVKASLPSPPLSVGGLPKQPVVPMASPMGLAKPSLTPGAPVVAPFGVPKPAMPPGAPAVSPLPSPPALGGLPKPPGAPAAPLPKAPTPIIAGAAAQLPGASTNDSSKTAIIKGSGQAHRPIAPHAPSGMPMPAKAPGMPVAPGAQSPVPAAAPKPSVTPVVNKPAPSVQPINVVGDGVSLYLAVAAAIVALASVAVTAASFFEIL